MYKPRSYGKGLKHYPPIHVKRFKDYIFKRDKNTCQICGAKRQKHELEIHHDKPCWLFPWLCYDYSNAYLVCSRKKSNCHYDKDMKNIRIYGTPTNPKQ
jgi:hypothetical protein